LRRALAICEVALALVLLACAGLLLRTFGKLQDVDLGFDSHNVLTMQLGLPSARYPFASEKPMIFYRNLLSRVAQLPGVEDAGAVSILPLGGDFDTTGIGVEGHNYAPGKEPSPERYIVTPGYFRALRIGLLRGRFFTDQDDTKIPVALVNSTAAARFWPGQDALGKHIAVVTDKNVRTTCVVVGVVNDVKQAGLNAPRSMQIYLPHALARNDNLTLTIRTASDPLALAASVRSQVLALDPELAISNVATLDQVLDNSIASQRFSTQLLGAFAALGLLLASIGVYGTLSYSVAQRTREIGIRVALGAARHDVLLLVLRNALTLVIAGVAAGLVGALVAARLLSGMVFGITTHDAATFIMTPVVLVAVALVACYVPAHRALRIDPVVALRYE
jgi:putative ABC transport system permease protein